MATVSIWIDKMGNMSIFYFECQHHFDLLLLMIHFAIQTKKMTGTYPITFWKQKWILFRSCVEYQNKLVNCWHDHSVNVIHRFVFSVIVSLNNYFHWICSVFTLISIHPISYYLCIKCNIHLRTVCVLMSIMFATVFRFNEC